jgi:pantoate--beta-alanine ligase
VDLLRSRAELGRLEPLRRQGPLVLVPTMGALHRGHLSLVREARARGPVVVSIFVNPTQFGAGEDYASYPRDLQGDLAALAPLAPQAVFAPEVDAIYGAGTGGVTVQPGPRARPLCGAHRPGHFAGVLTVVAKLFHLLRPDVAVFGRKDAQQVLVIAEMVRDLDFAVRVVDAPTVREPDGLALSSRNRYLGPEERKRAGCLWRGLTAARECLTRGERDPAVILQALREPLAVADSVDYVEIRSVPELAPVRIVAGRLLIAVAARVGPSRLIDNLVLEVTGDAVRDAALLEEGRA